MPFTPQEKRVYRNRLKDEGRCVDCGEKCGKKRVRCGECAEAMNRRTLRIKRRHADAGLCRTCGGEKDDLDRVECVNCQQKGTARKRWWGPEKQKA